MIAGSGERIRLRSPWRLLSSASLALAVLVVASFMVDVQGVLAAVTVASLAVGLAWVSVRILVLGGVVLVAEELRAHGLCRSRTVPRNSIVRSGAEVVDDKGLSVWAPVVERNDRRRIILKSLAGYSKSDTIPNARVRSKWRRWRRGWPRRDAARRRCDALTQPRRRLLGS